MPDFTIAKVVSEKMLHQWTRKQGDGIGVTTRYTVIDDQGCRWQYDQTYIIGLVNVTRGPRQNVQKL
jgi:hypothetical protein